MSSAHPFAELPHNHFGAILVDAPISFETWSDKGFAAQAIKQTIHGDKLGITPARLGNIYNGAELSKEVAFRLRERVPGLTLDRLWFGYWAGTPVELARNLRQLLDGIQPMPGS